MVRRREICWRRFSLFSFAFSFLSITIAIDQSFLVILLFRYFTVCFVIGEEGERGGRSNIMSGLFSRENWREPLHSGQCSNNQLPRCNPVPIQPDNKKYIILRENLIV